MTFKSESTGIIKGCYEEGFNPCEIRGLVGAQSSYIEHAVGWKGWFLRKGIDNNPCPLSSSFLLLEAFYCFFSITIGGDGVMKGMASLD